MVRHGRTSAGRVAGLTAGAPQIRISSGWQSAPVARLIDQPEDDAAFAELARVAKDRGWTLAAPSNRHGGYLLTSGKPGAKDARIAFGQNGPVLTLDEVRAWLADLPKG